MMYIKKGPIKGEKKNKKPQIEHSRKLRNIKCSCPMEEDIQKQFFELV